MKTFIFLLFFVIFLNVSCTNTEIGNSKDIEPNAIAQVINVEYNEGEAPKAKIRFRVSGDNGTTLVLNKPASVSFNSTAIKVDSNRFLGAYYAATQVEKGSNSFVYNAKDGRVYSNLFQFNGFGLTNVIPNTISKSNDLTISFFGLPNNEKINCKISDTANSTANIDNDYLLSNGILTIKASEIGNLKSGPLKINLHYFSSKPLKEVTSEGGKIVYDYTLNEIKTKLY